MNQPDLLHSRPGTHRRDARLGRGREDGSPAMIPSSSTLTPPEIKNISALGQPTNAVPRCDHGLSSLCGSLCFSQLSVL
jgi:hypothetical protein